MSLNYVSESSSPSTSSEPCGSKATGKKTRSPMNWTEEHDLFLCREILAINPFSGTKKNTVQRGQKWRQVFDNLLAIRQPKFTCTQWKAVKDRFNLLADKLRTKLKREMRASGIETNMTEVEKALEQLIEIEHEADIEGADAGAKKRQQEEEKATAEDIRQKAMERVGQTAKRKGEAEGESKKKRRSNGSDTLVYLREKSESMAEARKEEMELKKQEMELQAKKHDDFMKLVLAQQQQQAKAQQDFQNLMVTVLSRFAPK